jgi:tRNA dimethylallyltransferase
MTELDFSTATLVAIVGPTASGKTATAIELAERFNGEIICADSRTVYKELSIGTAKPTDHEQARIRHHCINLVSVGEPFTVADFQRHARAAIADIRARGKLPFIVGGTGLYVDAVLYDYELLPVDDEARAKYQQFTKEELVAEIEKLFSPEDAHVLLARAQNNERRLVRALEHKSVKTVKRSLPEKTIYIGLYPGKEILEQRIRLRLITMVADGVVDEATTALKAYDNGALFAKTSEEDMSSLENVETYQKDVRFLPESLTGNMYQALVPYIMGECSLEVALEDFVRKDLRLAKRQMTWFKRNPDIYWFENAQALSNSLT